MKLFTHVKISDWIEGFRFKKSYIGMFKHINEDSFLIETIKKVQKGKKIHFASIRINREEAITIVVYIMKHFYAKNNATHDEILSRLIDDITGLIDKN